MFYFNGKNNFFSRDLCTLSFWNPHYFVMYSVTVADNFVVIFPFLSYFFLLCLNFYRFCPGCYFRSHLILVFLNNSLELFFIKNWILYYNKVKFEWISENAGHFFIFRKGEIYIYDRNKHAGHFLVTF